MGAGGAARERGITLLAASSFDSVTGKGVRAVVQGRPVLVGSARLLATAGIDIAVLDPAAAELSGQGKTPVLAAIDGTPGNRTARAETAAVPVTDPVCGMTVEPASASDRRSSIQGTVYFCSSGCAAAFDADPGHYAAATSAHDAGTGN